MIIKAGFCPSKRAAAHPPSKPQLTKTGLHLVEKARKAKADFGQNASKKFAGAATVEILREALRAEGIDSSRRDVFIRGIGLEIDLVIPHRAANPMLGLVYEPNEVAAALEVKRSGSFGEKSIQKTRNDFCKLINVGIECAYVSFEERQSYRWRATKELLGGRECFTLAWHKNTDGPLEPTKDWERLLAYLRNLLALRPSHAFSQPEALRS